MTSAQRRAYKNIKKNAKKTALRDGGSKKPTVRRAEIKARAVEYKGGQCAHCGYNRNQKALDFHHTDPTQKDFSISTVTAIWRWDFLTVELDKCILLCANCHREEHDRLHKLQKRVGYKGPASNFKERTH